MKLKKRIPLIDQHNKNGFWGGKFGGNFVPETLKKPIEDLTILFERLRYEKKFLKQRDYYFKNYIGSPTSFIKLQNLSNYLGGAQIYAKMVSEANGGGLIKSTMQQFIVLLLKKQVKNILLVILVLAMLARC
tara:strand:- start:61 stop:456 length:396 start_codon:yes stop_codon:yes gene_type:complete